ncbi:hypothetical protein BASA62_009484, partial [Batrachochytrium salamandrivorans]
MREEHSISLKSATLDRGAKESRDLVNGRPSISCDPKKMPLLRLYRDE